jgi:hypothetical protein
MKITAHSLTEGLYAYSGLYIQKRQPIIVLAPGRVGSMSLLSDLRAHDFFAFKVERRVDGRGSAQFAISHILNQRRDAKIISIVRDPIEMLISYFYSKAARGSFKNALEALENSDIPRLQQIFITKVLNTERMTRHVHWFENEFHSLTGIDVYAYPFDTTQKCACFSSEPYDVLIFRTDLPDADKAGCVSKFLHTDSFKVSRGNKRETKPLSGTYKLFKDSLVVPTKILDTIYSAPYTQHFFSENEIREQKKRWSE